MKQEELEEVKARLEEEGELEYYVDPIRGSVRLEVELTPVGDNRFKVVLRSEEAMYSGVQELYGGVYEEVLRVVKLFKKQAWGKYGYLLSERYW